MSSCERCVRGWNFEVFEEGVESDEEFPRDSDEGDVVGFIGGAQFFVERREVGAVLGSGFGGHIEGFADDFSSAVDASFADPFFGLLRVRSDAGDRGDSLSREGSEFGKVGQQDASGLGAEAGGGLEGGRLGEEVFFLGDEFLDLLIELFYESRELLDAAFNIGGDESIGAAAEAVLLAGAVLDKLSPTIREGPEATGDGSRAGSSRRVWERWPHRNGR